MRITKTFYYYLQIAKIFAAVSLFIAEVINISSSYTFFPFPVNALLAVLFTIIGLCVVLSYALMLAKYVATGIEFDLKDYPD